MAPVQSQPVPDVVPTPVEDAEEQEVALKSYSLPPQHQHHAGLDTCVCCLRSWVNYFGQQLDTAQKNPDAPRSSIPDLGCEYDDSGATRCSACSDPKAGKSCFP